MKQGQKYEACIAKTTLPKGVTLAGSLKLDTWYPINRISGVKGDGDAYCIELVTPMVVNLLTQVNDSYWLGRGAGVVGGNWKIRKVKENKQNV